MRGFCVRVSDAREFQDRGDVRLIVCAQLGHFGRRVEVGFAVGHSEAALPEMREIVTGVFEALVDPDAEDMVGVGGEAIDFTVQGGTEICRERGFVCDCGDCGHLAGERSESSGVDGGLIHEVGVVCADFL